MQNKTILITGASGFIGSSLAEKLRQAGARAIAFDILCGQDILDTDAVGKIFAKNEIDCVVHLAARVGVRDSLKYPAAYAETNITGTANILEAMRTAGVRKIVFASSSSIYGDCRAPLFSEEFVPAPICPYGATKAAGEQLVKDSGIPAVVLRFFSVYGPRQRPDLAIRKFTEAIDSGRPIQVFGDGTSMRDYTFIDDIIDGIIAAMKYDKTAYEIINLACGNPIPLSKVIAGIEDALGKKAIIETLPMQAGDADRTAGDISKARAVLGFSPKTDFASGLRKFIEWRNAA